jgi:hypothetical protein
MILKDLNLTILPIANTYTGANFTTPPTAEQILTIQACSQFIVDMFPMIGLRELRLAFSMAAANKFPKLNLETYYGKFSVQFLGKILNAYLEKRKSVLAEHDKQLSIEAAKPKEEVTKERNEIAKYAIIKEYNQLKEAFELEGDLGVLNEKIMPYWGKILVQANVIKFTHEEKLEIVAEAKTQAKRELSKEITFGSDQSPSKRRTLKSVLDDVLKMKKNASFDDKWQAVYSKLIVIKSILKA